jgi:septation ring formation regulator EzrA
MTTITEIQSEIERLSEQRTDLYTELSRGRSETARQEIKQIDERLQRLWDAHRAERARIRFGEREDIVRRARAEDRLDRAA